MRAFVAFVALVLTAASAAGQTNPPAQHHTGELTTQAPRASFEVQLQAGQIVTLTASSETGLDTTLTLNGPNGRSVAENDDVAPGDLSSRIVYAARSAGRYTAIVSGYNNATGAFAFDVAYGLNVGLSPQARTLREETVSFTRRRTEQRFRLDLAANDIFVASTFALADGVDTTLLLVDASGTTVTSNDDRGDGTLNSQIIYQAARAGRFEVVASTFSGADIGDVVVSLAIDPNAEAPFNFASIEGSPLARYEGEITNEQPELSYNVEMAAGQTILVTSEAVTGNLDTVIRMNGPDGYPVAINDDRGDGSLNSAFAFTALVAGTYELEITRYQQGNSTGTFRLVLSNVDASVVDTLQALVENQVTLSGAEQIIETTDFRVHYTLEGRDAATEAYARVTADTLQAMYTAQTRMGWAAPIRDPNGRYRAYIAEANGDMGYMKPVQMVFDNPNTPNVRETAAARAVLVIDNDFANMNKAAPPESLMRATATHEFNHVIQHAYDAQEGLNWLYESTASWIETATVGVDQDATDYTETDFSAPQMCWTTNMPGHNYGQWTLLQSLADSHGERFIIRIWENTVTHDGFETMSQSLASVGSTIPEALRRWRVQNFARDYALAPKFPRSVLLAGSINRIGTWSPEMPIEQLGAQYISVRFQGPRAFALRGADHLELVGLGRRNGQIEVVPLGRGGVFDASVYDYAAVMVFNNAVPETPGACSGAEFSIGVTPSTGVMAAPQYRMSAAHFAPPSP